MVTRRGAMAAALVPWLGSTPARADGLRVAALDWSLAATAGALGVTPIGIAEQRLYGAWVGPPALPRGIPDLGLRTGPSLETLCVLKPDLILINPLNEPMRGRLEAIAPTFSNTTFTDAHAPIERGIAVTRALACLLGREAEAETVIAAATARLMAARARIAGRFERPLLPIHVIDAKHITFYGAGSLYTDVLHALGLRNDFAEATGPWGSVTRTVVDLAACPPTDVLLIDPIPPAAREMVDGTGLWSSLLAARGARQIRLPAVWAFGDLSAATRFAEVLADAAERS